MPYCTVPQPKAKRGAQADSEPVKIYYRTYGEGDCKIIMIMGVAATHTAWWPQIQPLTGTDTPNDPDEPSEGEEEEEQVEKEEEEGLGSLRPEQQAQAKSKSVMRMKSDLGHRAMMHGTEALQNRRSSGAETSSSSCSGSESPQGSSLSVFERLDSDQFQGIPEAAAAAAAAAAGERRSSGGSPGAPRRADKLTGRVVCVFDNRGVGRSSHPVDSKHYRTELMAQDAIALADHLKWDKFHVIGHSMGGMIACKVAALAPSRVASLAVISSSNGNFDLFPKITMRHFKLINKMLSAKTPEMRAAVDLDAHFSQEFLSEMVEGAPRREHLHKEYVRTLTTKGAMQPKHAQNGQISACWMHGLSNEDVRSICKAEIPTSVIHGSDDIVAHVSLGRRLAKRLHTVARFVELYGGHMIVRERMDEVNNSLRALLQAASQDIRGHEWASSDPHREEADARLETCISGSCGNCRACERPEPVWQHVLDAS